MVEFAAIKPRRWGLFGHIPSQIESEVHLNNVSAFLTVSTFARKAKGTAHVSRLSTQGSMTRLRIGNSYDSEMWTIAYPKQRCWPN